MSLDFSTGSELCIKTEIFRDLPYMWNQLFKIKY